MGGKTNYRRARHVLVSGALAFALMPGLHGSAAFADQPAPPAPSNSEKEPAASGSAEDQAWQLYDRAFEKLLAGDATSARRGLVDITERFPEHPAAVQAAARIAEIDAAGSASQSDEQLAQEDEDRGVERPRLQARAELGLNMTINGVFLALNISQMVGGDSERASTAAAMIGGGAGLAISLYSSRRGITAGHAQLLNSAITWGSWNNLLANEGFFADTERDAAFSVGFQVAGLATGMMLWPMWRPTSGDVAMANTGGVWSSILFTLLTVAATDDAPEVESLVLAGDLGILMGGLLSSRLPMSRGRTLLIDTGGVLGFVAGGLAALAADPDEDGGASAWLFAGTTAGLVTAFLATRNWDPPDFGKEVNIAMTPMGKRGWGATLSLEL